MTDDLAKYFDGNDDEEELKFDEDADNTSVVLDESVNDDPDDQLDAMFEPKKRDNSDFKVTPCTLKLSVEKFNTFMSILRGIRFSCDDVIINKGIIRQFNGRKTFIFEVDLRGILGETSLVINNLPSKFDLMSNLYQKQNVSVSLEIEEDKYIIKDENTQIAFKSPDFDLIDCKFLDKKDLQQITLKNQKKCIFKYDFNKMMISRIISSAKLLGSPCMRIAFNENKASFLIQPLDSTDNTIYNVGELEEQLNDTSLKNLLVTTKVQTFLNFLNAGCEQIEAEMHFRKEESLSCCFEMKSTLNVAGHEDGGEVPFLIYSMMKFLTPEEYLS